MKITNKIENNSITSRIRFCAFGKSPVMINFGVFQRFLKLIGILLVIGGFFSDSLYLMLLGIFFALLVLSNMLTCEAYELSNQIGDLKKEILDELIK